MNTTKIEAEKEFDISEYNWKEYLKTHWDKLWRGNRVVRKILDAIVSNGHYTINLWGTPGSGKSTLQRHLARQLYGSWDAALMFRIQSRAEFHKAIDFAKAHDNFHVTYNKTIDLSRLPLADIDDKGTIFPSSVGNNKEMAEWHSWWQTRRSDVAGMEASAPMTDDVRKRLRIGADAEILCTKMLTDSGHAVYYGKYYEFIYHSKWHDPDQAYLSKKYVCTLYWSQLPDNVLQREISKRNKLSDMLREKARETGADDDMARALVFDKDAGLMEVQKQIMEIISQQTVTRNDVSTRRLYEQFRGLVDPSADKDWLAKHINHLDRMKVVRYKKFNESSGQIELTQLGKMVCGLMKAETILPTMPHVPKSEEIVQHIE